MRLIDAECDELMETIGCRAFNTRRDIRDWLDSAPTVDAVPVVYGKWIHDGCRFKSGVDWCHCSECGKQDIFAARTNYCPDCGAKMDLEDK